MKVQGFIWLEQFVEKLIEKHSVETDEVEEVFWNGPKIKKVQRGDVRGEDVYQALGQTDAGRHLTVIFIRKLTGKVLVVSARDMDHKERRDYARK
jgi:uncharacterized DUF497 family protein